VAAAVQPEGLLPCDACCTGQVLLLLHQLLLLHHEDVGEGLAR
jgi:hypothetical protein